MSVKDFFKKMSEPEDIDDRFDQDDLYDSYDNDRRDSRRSDSRDDRYDDGYHEARNVRNRRESDEDYGARTDRRRSYTTYDGSDEDDRSGSYGGRSSRNRSDGYGRGADPYEDDEDRRSSPLRTDSRYDTVYEPDSRPYDDAADNDPGVYIGFDPKTSKQPEDPEPVEAEPIEEETVAVEEPKPLCFLPDSYTGVRKELVTALHDGNPIVVDVRLLDEGELQRLTDFVLGVALALDASLFRLDSSSVFVVAPKGTNPDPDEASDLMQAYAASCVAPVNASGDAANA